MAISNDGRNVATADTQETLRFWPLFDDSNIDIGNGGSGVDFDDVVAASANTIIGAPIGYRVLVSNLLNRNVPVNPHIINISNSNSAASTASTSTAASSATSSSSTKTSIKRARRRISQFTIR